MHAWKPGETITAAKLRSGYASGRATIPFSNPTGRSTVSAGDTGYDRDYYRQTVEITFPAGAFTSAPAVTATWIGTSPGTTIDLSIASITATGCVIWGARTPPNSGTIPDTDVYWVAVEASN